jgi:type III restriction enzyme
VPPAYQHALGELAHRLIITNYHEFLPRILGGNKRTPFDGKLGADGHKVESREDENQMLRRVLGSFKAGRRLLVINDEAHHCYLPRARGRDTELDNSETENERAAVWFSGLRACTRRFQVRVVYDLSATPYYLSGSGFPAYSLFPWVVSDFGLIEAIEAGLVKIPFLPIDDSSQAIDEPVLKNLYENCKAELPRKGQRTQRREAQETNVGEAAPNLPALVRQALDQFYAHYEEYERGLRRRGELKADLFTAPPVFIVVCGNTTVSREVFKEIAGYERVDESGQTTVVAGRFPLFSNFDRDSGRALPARRRCSSTATPSNTPARSTKASRRFSRPRSSASSAPTASATPSAASTASPTPNCCAKWSTPSANPTPSARTSVAWFPSPCSAKAGTPTPSPTSWACAPSARNCSANRSPAGRCAAAITSPTRRPASSPPNTRTSSASPSSCSRPARAAPSSRPNTPRCARCANATASKSASPTWSATACRPTATELAADFSGTPDYRLDTTRLPVETTLGTAVSEDRQTMRLKLDELRDQTVIYKLTRDYLRASTATKRSGPTCVSSSRSGRSSSAGTRKSSKSSAKTTRSTSAW